MSLRTVHKGAAAIHLTPIEYRLLTLLVTNAGKVLTHRQILREVWGPSHADDGHYVRVYMGHLRHKLEDDPAQPKHILTETAVGYRLVHTLGLSPPTGVGAGVRARGREAYRRPARRMQIRERYRVSRQPAHQVAQPSVPGYAQALA